jgi:hypothetical protein
MDTQLLRYVHRKTHEFPKNMTHIFCTNQEVTSNIYLGTLSIALFGNYIYKRGDYCRLLACLAPRLGGELVARPIVGEDRRAASPGRAAIPAAVLHCGHYGQRQRSRRRWGFCGPASCKDDYLTCSTADGGGPQTVDGVAGTWAPSAGSNGASCKSFLPR